MNAEHPGKGGGDNKSGLSFDPRSAEKPYAERDRTRQHQQVEDMPAREQQRPPGDRALELSECDDRPGKCDRTDANTDVYLDQVDGSLGPGQRSVPR